jgi:hypothetical protein
VREDHSSGTDGFEASVATAKAIGVGSDAMGKLGGRDGLTVAATATNLLWICPRVTEATDE